MCCSKIKHDTLHILSVLIIISVRVSQRWCNLMHAQYRQNYIIIRQFFFCFLISFCQFCVNIITHNITAHNITVTFRLTHWVPVLPYCVNQLTGFYLRATLALNGLNRGVGLNEQGGLKKAFCLFWSQWRKYIQIYLCTSKFVIFGKGKKWWSNCNFRAILSNAMF